MIIGVYWAFSSTFALRGMEPDADIMGIWLAFTPLRIFLIIVGPIGAVIEDFITRGFIMSELKKAGLPCPDATDRSENRP